MAAKSGKTMVDEPASAPKAPVRAVAQCAAYGCPLPGTGRNESGLHLCACHINASAEGWPRATAISIKHAALWEMARQAQSAAPSDRDAAVAGDLFAIAKADGLWFSDAQRALYKRAGMKLRAAGSIVESAIREMAVAAAIKADIPQELGRPKLSRLEERIMGAANNLRMAA